MTSSSLDDIYVTGPGYNGWPQSAREPPANSPNGTYHYAGQYNGRDSYTRLDGFYTIRYEDSPFGWTCRWHAGGEGLWNAAVLFTNLPYFYWGASGTMEGSIVVSESPP